MAVVLISAKRVTNMKQIKKKEYEGNEAASRENNPSNIPGRSLQWQNYVTLRGD